MKQEHASDLQQLALQHAEALRKVQLTSSRSIPGDLVQADASEDHAQTLLEVQQEHAEQLAKLKAEADLSCRKHLRHKHRSTRASLPSMRPS